MDPEIEPRQPRPIPTAPVHFPVLPPLSALIEIAVLFGVIAGADWLHTGIDIADIRPHPFWIPVLLLSLQYGTASGLLAAGVAIAITALNGFPEQSTSETYFAYFLKIWIEPILWVGAAVLLGQFRMRQIARKEALIVQISELATQHAAVSEYARKLRTHCTALERQIAGRSEPNALLVLAAMNPARSTHATDEIATLGNAFARIIGLVLPGARATLYSADATGLRLTAAAGISAEGSTRAWIPTTDPLYRAIVTQAQSFSVLSSDGEIMLAGAGLAAVPVRSTALREVSVPATVVGMLKIEEMDPASLNRAILPAMQSIAHALAPAIEHLLQSSGQIGVTPAAVPAAQPESSGRRLLRHLRWFGRPENENTAPMHDIAVRTKLPVIG